MVCVPSNFFFEMSHAFSEVTSVTRDRFVRNSGFEAQIIADLRPILRVPPGQRYRGASGGLITHMHACNREGDEGERREG
jgi:hypothetical protein